MFRVVHVVKSAQPECTGICRIIMSLAKSAKRHGYELAVLFLADGPLKESMSAAGINAQAVSWDGAFQDVLGALRVCLWLRRNRSEIAHLHWGGRAVRAICRLGGAQAVVQHIHSRISEATGDIPANISFPWVDAVVACSNAVAGCVINHRPEVIYAGVEVNPAPELPTMCSGLFQIGTLSRLTPIKNIGAVIKATAKLKDSGVEVVLNIAGSGPSEQELRNLAAELGVADRVRFLGWREDLLELLSGWDLVVMPSFDEGFGLAALEAMAAARPVIASRVGGLSEIVMDGVTGILIPPHDTDALVHHIAELANDRAKSAEMGQAGWERARLIFSEETTATRTASLYDRLIRSGVGARASAMQ